MASNRHGWDCNAQKDFLCSLLRLELGPLLQGTLMGLELGPLLQGALMGLELGPLLQGGLNTKHKQTCILQVLLLIAIY